MSIHTTFDYQRAAAESNIPLLQAAGLYNDALTPMQIYEISGYVQHDAVVAARYTQALITAPRDEKYPAMRKLTPVDVVATLSAVEKRELRDRVIAKLPKGSYPVTRGH